MPVKTYKPWIDGRGQPVAVEDSNGQLVSKADYDALEKQFFASNKAIAELETPKPTGVFNVATSKGTDGPGEA